MARPSWTSDPVEEQRHRRRDTVHRLRAQGRYGPRFRDVLPSFAVLAVLLCAAVAGLVVGFRAVGAVVPIAGALLAVVAVAVGVRRQRPAARRRRGRYTPQELHELDVQGLALAVARMLRRDHWKVRLLPAPDRPRLCARHQDGRRLDVAFRPVAEPLPDEALPHPRTHREDPESFIHLVVHRGAFRARDIRWARREGRTVLLDGPALERWAGGAPLDRLLAGEQ
ncbi:hypothetical protein DI272_43545 [Streptomyces sp. Act143]|uniref:hypothetical protein n=1 Tax=Streptomyces sp. Act143 TaxID=2200760 RepID=UPI000D674B41|nr:hypothetical protein [Streptomyces sp. Act143]PWI12669.1 hypothetical protein DI272_43545 [Streptomyces sp. Act143]